jgi:hypothetical protein
LQADSRWRESRMHELFGPDELGFGTIDSAFESMAKMETLRRQFVEEDDETGIKRLFDYGRELKRRLELQVPGSILAEEVVQWLGIWLQTPDLLDDWLGLRRNSADFARKFGV